jgi:ERF superfamily
MMPAQHPDEDTMNDHTELTHHPAFASPLNLIATALNSGASIEMVRELLALKREHEADEARKAWNAAMADAAAELPAILKTKLVDFTTTKGRTTYKYEGLDSVVDAVRPVLAKHGLSHSWEIVEQGDRIVVTCRIAHRDGHSQGSTLSAPRDESGMKNYIQSKGSAITYLQRYTLKAALGLAASIDDDGAAAGAAPGQDVSTTITPEQAASIVALADDIADKGVLDRVRAQLNVATIEEIPAARFETVIKRLRATKVRESQSQPPKEPAQ